MRTSDWSSDVCSSDLRDLGERRDHGTNGLESIAWCDLDDFRLLSRVGHMMPSRPKASISLLSRARSSVSTSRLWAPRSGPVHRTHPGDSGTWGTIPACKTLPKCLSGRSEAQTSELQSLMPRSYA